MGEGRWWVVNVMGVPTLAWGLNPTEATVITDVEYLADRLNAPNAQNRGGETGPAKEGAFNSSAQSSDGKQAHAEGGLGPEEGVVIT